MSALPRLEWFSATWFAVFSLAAAVSFAVLPQPLRAGKLQNLREDVRSDSSDDDRDDDDDDRDCHRHHYHCHSLAEAEEDAEATWFMCKLITSPIWAPRGWVNDLGGNEGYFPGFPYRNGDFGYMMFGEYTSPPRRWEARVRGEYVTNFKDLSSTGGQLLLGSNSRLGIDSELNYLEEHLPNHGRDDLWIGDFNVTYRFAQSERSQWRVGVGFNWLDDPTATDFGINFTYGFDFFPAKPWVFSTEMDLGQIGEATAFHFRTTAGVMINRCETYIGYEYREIDRFYFNGMIAGVRFWF